LVTAKGSVTKKQQKQLQAEQRQRLKPLRDELKKAEKALDKLYAQQTVLEEKLADTELYQDSQKEQLKTIMEQKRSIDKKLEQEEENWLMAQDALEEASNRL